MEKFRSRKFCILLYPEEDETHKKALEYIKLNYDYALIVHDKDKNEVGELKKSHTHVVIATANAKWNTALSEELGIGENYIEKCRAFDNALEYLIHYNDDTKEQYDISEVKGPLKTKLEKILANDGKDENQKAEELIDFIRTYPGTLDEYVFIKYCCSLGMWDVFRRASYVFIRLIDKHNQHIDYSSENKKSR